MLGSSDLGQWLHDNDDYILLDSRGSLLATAIALLNGAHLWYANTDSIVIKLLFHVFFRNAMFIIPNMKKKE